MAGTVTVTGKEMGGIAVTAKVISNVRNANFDCINQVLRVTKNDDFVEDVDISAATTITATVSSGTYTFTIS